MNGTFKEIRIEEAEDLRRKEKVLPTSSCAGNGVVSTRASETGNRESNGFGPGARKIIRLLIGGSLTSTTVTLRTRLPSSVLLLYSIFLSLYSLMGPATNRVTDGRGRGPYETPLRFCPAYRDLAMELIFLCRFFAQTHEQNSNSSIRLRK